MNLKRPHLNKPLQETPIINKRAPLTKVPVHVLQCINTQARFSTKQNNNTFCLGRYKSKKKHISASTVVAFKDCFSKRTIFMKTNFLVFGSNLQKGPNKTH